MDISLTITQGYSSKRKRNLVRSEYMVRNVLVPLPIGECLLTSNCVDLQHTVVQLADYSLGMHVDFNVNDEYY